MVTGKIETALEGATMGQVITGSGCLTAPPGAIGGRGASTTSLFRTAQDFLKAAETLDPVVVPGPFGFVSAQCLELVLKAFLLVKGMTEKDFTSKRGIGHKVDEAWTLCVQKGLGLDAAMPTWAEHCARGHESLYLFRYAKDNTGIVLAPKATVLDGGAVRFASYRRSRSGRGVAPRLTSRSKNKFISC